MHAIFFHIIKTISYNLVQSWRLSSQKSYNINFKKSIVVHDELLCFLFYLKKCYHIFCTFFETRLCEIDFKVRKKLGYIQRLQRGRDNLLWRHFLSLSNILHNIFTHKKQRKFMCSKKQSRIYDFFIVKISQK